MTQEQTRPLGSPSGETERSGSRVPGPGEPACLPGMRFRRTLPPAAAPLSLTDLLHAAAGIVIGRRYAKRLEAELKGDFGVRHVFLVSSGQAALALALRSLAVLSRRREVVVPAYTCFSVPAAVVRAGLPMRVADVSPRTFEFDHTALAEAMGPDTLAVIAAHLFGITGDLDTTRKLCERHGAFLVEDAAQAMGGQYGSRKLGCVGDVGIFSLGRGKNITAGSGGIVVTNDSRIAEALAAEYGRLEQPGVLAEVRELLRLALMSLFIHPRLYWFPAGLPWLRLGETRYEPDFPVARLSGVSAGALWTWRTRLAQGNARRVRAGEAYRARLGAARVPDGAVPFLRLPVLMPSREARDQVYALGCRRGLGVGLMYPSPVNEIGALRPRFAGQRFPAAETIAERLLTLPTHHLVTETDQRMICDLVEGGNDPRGGER